MRGEALLLVAFLVGGAPGGGEPAREAPPFVRRLVEVSAETWEEWVLAPHKGRVLVVNFWATFCAPWLEKLYALVRAWRRFEEDPVDVVLVSADFGDSAHEDVAAHPEEARRPLRELAPARRRPGPPGEVTEAVTSTPSATLSRSQSSSPATAMRSRPLAQGMGMAVSQVSFSSWTSSSGSGGGSSLSERVLAGVTVALPRRVGGADLKGAGAGAHVEAPRVRRARLLARDALRLVGAAKGVAAVLPEELRVVRQRTRETGSPSAC